MYLIPSAHVRRSYLLVSVKYDWNFLVPLGVTGSTTPACFTSAGRDFLRGQLGADLDSGGACWGDVVRRGLHRNPHDLRVSVLRVRGQGHGLRRGLRILRDLLHCQVENYTAVFVWRSSVWGDDFVLAVYSLC